MTGALEEEDAETIGAAYELVHQNDKTLSSLKKRYDCLEKLETIKMMAAATES